MTLVHGREITAEQIELIVGRQFSVQRFASMCNAIGWALSRPAGLNQAALTERVYVADNGIDAELLIDIPPLAPASGSLFSPGRVVLQYKQRDVTAQDRNRIIGDLRRDLARAAQKVRDRTGQPLSSYLLFTNASLTLEQKQQLEEAIKEGSDGTTVHVIGAAELAAMLNNLPHLRSAYFSTLRFATWQRSWESHKSASLGGAVPPYIGRVEMLAATRAAVDDPNIRVLVLAGPPDMGKTRLALESTNHKPFDTVVATDGHTLTVADMLALITQGQHPLAIVDDPDQNTTEALISTAFSSPLKLILTVPSSEVGELVNYGRDPRVKVLSLVPLMEDESRDLLLAAGARLDYSVLSWITEQAGGNPGVLIAAASVGEQLRIEGTNFFEQVGNAIEIRARTVLGAERVANLGFLSVMTAVGFSGHAFTELESVCETLGVVRSDLIVSDAGMTARAGFLRIRGNYLEVTPPIFANYLAERTLGGRATEIARLFLALAGLGKVRLLKRLRQLRGEAVQAFWNELFRNGPLSTFEGALAQAALLRIVAPAAPGRVGSLILQGLQGLSVDDRRAIGGDARRQLVWTVDRLLFRSQTSQGALRCLALLAEAENERWGNSSSGVFAECFHPLHPQLPLPIGQRLSVLRELLIGEVQKPRKLLALKAAEEAFARIGSVMLRRSEGADPFDTVPRVTYGEIREYLRSIIELIRPLMADANADVARKAGETVMTSLGEYTVKADHEGGAALIEDVSRSVVDGTAPVQMETYVSTLKYVTQAIPAEPRFANVRGRVQTLLEDLENAGFETKLKRWVGSWEVGDEKREIEGRQVYRGEQEIQILGRRAAGDRNLLSDVSISWLTSAEAKRAHEFFYWLGKYDRGSRWQAVAENLGQREDGAQAFASYFGGRASESPAEIDELLDEIAATRRVLGPAIVGATGFLPGNARAIRRMVALINDGHVQAEVVERRLMAGGWMNPLNDDDVAELLRAIAGESFDRAVLVIDFLAMWVHSEKAFRGALAEVAWRALEAAPQSGEAWDFDQVAAALAPTDYDRAFELLRRYLMLPHDHRSWEPLDRHYGNKFWNLLWEANHERCLELLLQVGAASPLAAWKVTWNLPEILNLVRDREVLLRFARKCESNAEFVSSWLASKEGFWPLAVQLLALHPDNQIIRRNVGAALEHMNRVVAGLSSQNYANWAREIETIAADDATPNSVRPFLQELTFRFRRHSEEERRAEQDEEVNW